jgi:hypothetical protein
VHVRMLEAQGHAARAARSARLGGRSFADGELREPEGEPLLADPAGPVEEERGGEYAARVRTGERGARGLMALERM